MRDEVADNWLKVKRSTVVRKSLGPDTGNFHYCNVVQATGAKVSSPVCSDKGASLKRMHMPSVVTSTIFVFCQSDGWCLLLYNLVHSHKGWRL